MLRIEAIEAADILLSALGNTGTGAAAAIFLYLRVTTEANFARFSLLDTETARMGVKQTRRKPTEQDISKKLGSNYSSTLKIEAVCFFQKHPFPASKHDFSSQKTKLYTVTTTRTAYQYMQ
jgi:hypothetical protein